MANGRGLFLEIINDVIYTVSLRDSNDPSKARVEYLNGRVEDITGFKPEEFIKNPSLWVSLVHPSDLESVLKDSLRLFRRGESVTREYRVRTKRGNYIWVEDRIMPVFDGDRVVGFVGVARDITKRKVIESLSIVALEKSLDELLSSAVSMLKETLNADLVVLYEVPEGSSEGVLRAGEGIDRKLINRYRLPLQEGTEFHYTFTSKKPVVVKDVDSEKRFKFTPDTYILGLRSGICVPIRIGKEPYGALCIYTKDKREFLKEDMDFVGAVANIVGLAIKRHRNEKELKSSRIKLEKANRLYKTLSVISEIVLRAKDVEELLSGVCSTCVNYGGFKAVWVGLFEEGRFKIVSSCGDAEDFIRSVEEPILMKIKEGVGPCGRAFLSGEPVVNNDTEAFIREQALRESMLRKGYLSSMSVPLKLKGKIKGIFALYAGEKGFFDEDTLGLVREIVEEVLFSLEFMEKENQLRQLSLAVSQSSDWILITDREGKIQYANSAVEKISGYKVAELIGQKPSIFKSGKHSQSFYRVLWEKLLMGETFRSVFINRAKDGKLFYLDQTITPLRDSSGEIMGFVATGKDITQEKELQNRLNYIAYYDPITELPNRVNFLERLKFAISRNRMLRRNLAVLFIDVDRFKFINETYGYPVGDQVLKEVADRIKSAVREGDTVARLGSDEFGAVLIDLAHKEDIPKVMNKLFKKMEEPIRVNGHEILLTLSVGIAVFPEDGSDAEELIQKAEMALAHAKEDRRNNYQFFREEMNRQITEAVFLESLLFKAIDKGEFFLQYQPYFDLKSMTIAGMEALLRWNSGELGIVYPGKFIPVLENTGLISEVGMWSLREACRVVEKTGKRVSVNVSALQFRDKDFPKKVEEVLEEFGIEGGYITLEITESTLMNDVDFTRRSLKRLKNLGLKVAIDDFGTGYSSLAYLKTLPVDYVKIDVSFVRDMDKDPNDRAIVNAIVQLAKNLGLSTIAEGVEKEKHLRMLLEMGCDMAQGYFLSKPLSEEDLMNLLREHG